MIFLRLFSSLTMVLAHSLGLFLELLDEHLATGKQGLDTGTLLASARGLLEAFTPPIARLALRLIAPGLL